MANRAEIKATYGYMDEFMRAALDPADITCAFFNGDYELTLKEAQDEKHNFILDGLGFRNADTSPIPQQSFFDVGCGWGGLLQTARSRNLAVSGCTLDSGQAKYCNDSLGLDVKSSGWEDLGGSDSIELENGQEAKIEQKFDGIASVGAFEHFVGGEEYYQGKQEEKYSQFFARMHSMLKEPGNGRLFVQAMFLGKNAPDLRNVSLLAPKGSREYIAARVMDFYPNSYPPQSLEQVVACAEPYFELESANNGRLDYIETMHRWGEIWKPTPRKLLAGAKIFTKALTDIELQYKLRTLRGAYNRQCFEQEILDHWRIIFKSKGLEIENSDI